MTFARRIRWGVRLMVLMALVPSVWLFARWWSGNVDTVIPGRFYRSAQLGPDHLTGLIARHGCRTVLNLRGPNPSARWYREERDATLQAGATQVDLPIASDLWLSKAQAQALMEVLDSAEKPMLVHCQWGAERTGLASAFVVLLRPGGTLDEAEQCFSIRYLFAPTRDGLTMLGHVTAYRRWLANQGWQHSPERFRHWVRHEYQPGPGSPEYWPYNPNPLMVVTSPIGPPRTLAVREEMSRH